MQNKTIEDLVKDSPCKGKGWCFLREIVKHIGMDDRMAEQTRLIYDYKFIESSKEGKDIGIERATTEFISQYAVKYAEVWKEGMTHEELKYEVFVHEYDTSKK